MSKIFPQLRTTDTVTTSRLGEKIPIPAFWATFLLHFPATMNLQQVKDSLNTLFPILIYAEPNYLGYSTAGANDSLYENQQAALHPTASFSSAHVNVEPAWNIETGKPTVKVGVFDTGLDWKHEDFGYDGVNPSSSQMIDGWDFLANTRLKSVAVPDYFGHGTNVAGIIGAIRNNRKGIAGIAGGDYLTNQKGVSLYGLRVNTNSGGFEDNGPRHALNYFADGRDYELRLYSKYRMGN